MMRYELALLDKNHRDLHAMSRLCTKLEQNPPSRKKVGNRDLKTPSRGDFVVRGKMVAVNSRPKRNRGRRFLGEAKVVTLYTYEHIRYPTFLVQISKGNTYILLPHFFRRATHLSVTSDQRAEVNEGFMKVAKHAFA